jgi:hypothetical protein
MDQNLRRSICDKKYSEHSLGKILGIFIGPETKLNIFNLDTRVLEYLYCGFIRPRE